MITQYLIIETNISVTETVDVEKLWSFISSNISGIINNSISTEGKLPIRIVPNLKKPTNIACEIAMSSIPYDVHVVNEIVAKLNKYFCDFHSFGFGLTDLRGMIVQDNRIRMYSIM